MNSLSLMVLALIGFKALAQVGPPDLNCITTDLLGNVTFHWEIPADPNLEFVNYHLWRMDDLNGTNEILIAGTINNYIQQQISWVGADANNVQRHFYMFTEWTDGTNTFYSEHSDTLCNILLDVVPSFPSGFAELSWSGPYTETGAPPGSTYEIWKQDLLGWNMIDEVPLAQTTFDDPVEECEALYSYQIIVQHPIGCQSESNIVTDNFGDSTTPDIPEVTYVTVDPVTGNAVVNWTQSEAEDTWGYIIYMCDQWGEQPVDTVYFQDQETFENVNSLALFGSESYIVAAFDSCQVGDNFVNISPTNGNCHSTIHLQPPSFFACQDFVTLNWSGYDGWPNDVAQYEILFSENGGAQESAGFVDGNTLTFVHENLTLGSTYEYFIQAYAAGQAYTSLSNGFSINIQVDNAPTDTHLLSATVIDRYEVNVLCQTLPVTLAHEYILEKRRDFDNEFDFIANTFINDLAPNPPIQYFTFVDYDVDARFREYEYRVTVLNDCGDTVAVTNLGHTINLNGIVNNSTMTNTLIWNQYQDWFDEGVESYNIYRSQTEGFGGDLIANVPAGQNFYEDDVSDLIMTPGLFCYRVEAIPEAGSIFDGISAYSNECCLQMDPKVWIPNAFMVHGNNSTFYPVISFADFETYRMEIYSRWGDIIYISEDIGEPWKGKKDGTLLPEGVYAYYIEIRDGKGQQHEFRGTVMLLIADVE